MKIVAASDIHYCVNLEEEIRKTSTKLPRGFFNHKKGRLLIWHNIMMVHRSEEIMSKLLKMVEQEKPDLCIFLGDMVNTNWAENVKRFAAHLARLPCPFEWVTGNHDLYLEGAKCRLEHYCPPKQEGFRMRIEDGFGLLFLDSFVIQPDGSFARKFEPERGFRGVGYRPADIEKVRDVIRDNAPLPFLLFAHEQVVVPEERLLKEGRKVGGSSESLSALRSSLVGPGNLQGVVSGHQHACHLRRFEYGFQWMLPAIVEYPCAFALLEINRYGVEGEVRLLDKEIARESLIGEPWPEGCQEDRTFRWAWHCGKKI